MPSPEDRPDPNERTAVRARVPDHVAIGNISTGVIVVTGGTEFVLDFVRNLPRPSMVVARVVLPHAVMPQFVDALSNNIGIFRQRFGDAALGTLPAKPLTASDATTQSIVTAQHPQVPVEMAHQPAEAASHETERSAEAGRQLAGAKGGSGASVEATGGSGGSPPASGATNSGSSTSGSPNSPVRQPSPQEVYDDLKLKDELLSGAYANAVMIGHGPHEFCFDFITNFYPQSAVSCRVFMSAGHISRLLDSLRTSWEQLRPRLGGNPPTA